MILKINQIEDYKKWLDTGPEGITPEKIIYNVEQGIYKAALCDDTGIIIYYPNGSIVHVVWFYSLPGTGKKSIQELRDFFRKEGFYRVRAGSKRCEKAFVRLTGMKKIYTVYETILGD